MKEFDHNLMILGDKNLVEIVLRNLLNNAVKFSCKGDEIILFVHLEGEQIKLGVKDTGLGISEKNLEKILAYNCNLSTLGTAREKGTGLGLMLCQTFLNKMNTKLIIENNPPKGCSFSFLLPKG